MAKVALKVGEEDSMFGSLQSIALTRRRIDQSKYIC
jgi:hypothetical protein